MGMQCKTLIKYRNQWWCRTRSWCWCRSGRCWCRSGRCWCRSRNWCWCRSRSWWCRSSSWCWHSSRRMRSRRVMFDAGLGVVVDNTKGGNVMWHNRSGTSLDDSEWSCSCGSSHTARQTASLYSISFSRYGNICRHRWKFQIEALTTVGYGVASGSRRGAGLAGVGGGLEACLWMEHAKFNDILADQLTFLKNKEDMRLRHCLNIAFITKPKPI